MQPIYRLHRITNKVRKYNLGKTSHIYEEELRTKVSELNPTPADKQEARLELASNLTRLHTQLLLLLLLCS